MLNDFSKEIPLPAPKKVRVAAAIIDFHIICLLAFIIGIFWGERYFTEDGFGFKMRSGLSKLLFLITIITLVPVLEAFTGQPIGKRILKIEVISKKTFKRSFLRSLIRHFFDVFDLLLFVGLLIAALNKNNQRTGDLVAGTLVVKKRI